MSARFRRRHLFLAGAVVAGLCASACDSGPQAPPPAGAVSEDEERALKKAEALLEELKASQNDQADAAPETR